MAWTSWYDWTAGDTATAARLDQIATNVQALIPVGTLTYVVMAATSSENLVNSCWLECNGASVLRATYPDLSTLLSGLSYPFGAADGTHMTLPDLRGRSLWGIGTHTNAGIGDNDGVTESSRQPKHTHTAGSLAVASHTHSLSTVAAGAGQVTSPGAGTGAYVGNSTSSATGSAAPSISGSAGSGMSGSDAVAHFFAGCYLIKAVN